MSGTITAPLSFGDLVAVAPTDFASVGCLVRHAELQRHRLQRLAGREPCGQHWSELAWRAMLGLAGEPVRGTARLRLPTDERVKMLAGAVTDSVRSHDLQDDSVPSSRLAPQPTRSRVNGTRTMLPTIERTSA